MSLKRRNGQLSSCEPCRKAKLRCDHGTPICGRCVQRRLTDMCIYHPAPLTRPRAPEGAFSPPKKRRCELSIISEKGATTKSILKYRVPASSPLDGHEEDDCSDRKLKPRETLFSTGFLGPSSYWAAFDEPEENRALCVTPAHSAEQTDTPSEAIMETAFVDSDQIECGARILSLLDDLPLYTRLNETRLKICQPWVFDPRVTREIFSSLNALRNHWLRSSKNKSSESKLLAWSQKIFDNSARPITTTRSTTVTEYYSSITARWETIGLIFTLIGISTTIIPENHECLQLHDGTVVDKHKLNLLVVEVVELCLGFCDRVGTMSDPLSWLLLQHTVLLAETYGDSDYRPWRKLGDLSTMLFALGLHRPETNPCIPFFLIEVRNRIMVAAYSLDKRLATVLGRPPRIAWHYCDIQHPLDLSYDEIFSASDEQRQEDVNRKLGPDGWNVDGRLTSGSKARMHLMFALIREKILALSLSPHPDDMAKKISETCAEHEQLRANLPPAFKWKPSVMNSAKTMDFHCEFLADMHLEFLNNDFILYRVLVRRTGKGTGKLLEISRELLSTMLTIISRALPSRANNDSSYLCFIGLPCAAVLARELLRRSLQNQGRSLYDQKQTPSNPGPFPRSEVIQKLSVFSSHLENILDLRDGNYEIAQKGLDAIRNVLDRVLSDEGESAAPHEHTQQPLLDGAPASIPADFSNILPEFCPEEDTSNDFMTWLDNMDWAQESLLSYS